MRHGLKKEMLQLIFTPSSDREDDLERISIADGKGITKWSIEDIRVENTMSLKDILGGSTITKEDVETYHKENFPGPKEVDELNGR